MTPLEKLEEIVVAAVPAFQGNTLKGHGRVTEEFIEENITKMPSCYISWDGFDRDNRYESGKQTAAGLTERCKLYIRVAKDTKATNPSIRDYVQAIRKYVNTETTMFEEDGERRDIKITSGFAERDDQRGDRFTIDVIII
jgi:hypothetical protein